MEEEDHRDLTRQGLLVYSHGCLQTRNLPPYPSGAPPLPGITAAAEMQAAGPDPATTSALRVSQDGNGFLG